MKLLILLASISSTALADDMCAGRDTVAGALFSWVTSPTCSVWCSMRNCGGGACRPVAQNEYNGNAIYECVCNRKPEGRNSQGYCPSDAPENEAYNYYNNQFNPGMTNNNPPNGYNSYGSNGGYPNNYDYANMQGQGGYNPRFNSMGGMQQQPMQANRYPGPMYNGPIDPNWQSGTPPNRNSNIGSDSSSSNTNIPTITPDINAKV
ncbi:hypothetical protein WR25_01993 [Diploscapter pachys]|uniref:Uncharacterized protein n=1 Tax=Diploscapter pachys TaxID=2018661 RepID=A0A2A2L4F1_9BILA|nr:hypothetical protein WR25_01993 [Diploscapter pachys]